MTQMHKQLQVLSDVEPLPGLAYEPVALFDQEGNQIDLAGLVQRVAALEDAEGNQ